MATRTRSTPPAHAFASTRQRFTTASGTRRAVLLAARSWPRPTRTSSGCRCRSASCSRSVLRNCDGKKVDRRARGAARQLAAECASAATRSPSSSRAWCCRTSPACRCWPTWPRCATWPPTWARTRRRIEPLVPVDLVVDHSVMVDHYGTQAGAGPEHEAGVPAQPGALPVHEVGHAGLRHLRRRAAGLRHRAPGEPGVPGARRAQDGRTASTTPTRWSAPTATRR